MMVMNSKKSLFSNEGVSWSDGRRSHDSQLTTVSLINPLQMSLWCHRDVITQVETTDHHHEFIRRLYFSLLVFKEVLKKYKLTFGFSFISCLHCGEYHLHHCQLFMHQIIHYAEKILIQFSEMLNCSFKYTTLYSFLFLSDSKTTTNWDKNTDQLVWWIYTFLRYILDVFR